MIDAATRPAWVEVDLAAIRENAAALAAYCAPADLCAVVKADGYGHGACDVAMAALGGGASRLAVAVVEEGVELRRAGVTAPVLVLADPAPEAISAAREARLAITVSNAETLAAVAEVAGHSFPGQSVHPLAVHLKVDTGMHRMGCEPDDLLVLCRSLAAMPNVELEAIWTHLAAAEDQAMDDVTREQLTRFDLALAELAHSGIEVPMLHVANSAGALYHPNAQRDLVRCGISLYGHAPDAARALPEGLSLRPALSLRASVTSVRSVLPGDGVSYGWVTRVDEPTRVATIPLGYADGVPRCLGEAGAEVLIGGRRCAIAGTVTMDQLMVRCGPEVSVGDEVMLLGRQGDEEVTAADWARLAGTVNYEILSRLGPRLSRRYV